jgi:DNA-binding transcriptional MerR regulator
MKLVNPFNREFWIDEVREALKHVPAAGAQAMQQARLSAIALESDREQLREDLMRRRRENLEERERIESALDELDALRILERAS